MVTSPTLAGLQLKQGHAMAQSSDQSVPITSAAPRSAAVVGMMP